MKNLLLAASLLICSLAANAQEAPKLYHPEADAKADIAAAVKKASAEHKNVLLQIGGNWCIWCLRFNDLVTKDPDLSSYLAANYEVVHVNYSAENKNEKLLAELGYPQRFGFPVFVVLDGKGKLLHTQNSAYLEEGKGHSKGKVLEFFKNWSPEALDPKTYAASK
ncbi:thioredoxin family protein [Mucilaginibacter segetis]|uniref:Thioredoxin family protein n=1 Tax=Mucilaginibacter segetis TaxID=2793071 RepID=A0A934PNY3_9SPHI|nr:thioredoxin family protein [Mucilaginibacter segetis]MBK0378049.1 thioredoxin family protein [Mucilaginibacter segetis]